ncbi:NRG-like protein [Mya arenaria]|uniref:NRG-like protein n=1 Tax=Mya arenaria TaxID=6604 RepID=A0ABY7F8E5_MYAAR|nr:neuroglian-like [Mya arenaria]XP_052762579.1 neuroglian-like [Mya arenaria]XP_052762580.1 neuroglian-like [Mya arenaria]XP_052762581.1 neuroglian-like [Mya arenaria]XP_052762583.1 neuroglian-like [Mya arenaria]WAR17044.1 NRG-like protein [Mya arenaria]
MIFAASLLCLAALTSVQGRGGSPPKISIPQGNNWPKSFEYIRKGNKETFECVAVGPGPLKYEWRYNGQRISARPEEVRFDENAGSLFIGEYFNEQLTGDYQCVVSNAYGTAMTPYLTISATVAYAFPGGENTFAKNVEAYATNYFTMDCENIPRSVPQWTFDWQRGIMVGNTLSDTSRVPVGERMVIDPKGTLHFLWVESSDNGYIYACETKNEIILMDVRNTQTFKLNVMTGSGKDRSPELKYNGDVTVEAGQRAKLTCIFTYYSARGEKLQIDWIFQNKKVGEGTTLVIENVKIPDALQNQEGQYMCEARLGNMQPVRGTVTLKIIAPPEFVPGKAPQLTSVPVEKNADFHCSASSHNSHMQPPVWMVNGVPLIGCPPNYFDCDVMKTDGFSECIPEKQVCDNNPDCSNEADEKKCQETTCAEGLKVCNDKCVNKDAECLSDSSVCSFPGWSCDRGKKCLVEGKRCDGTKDCTDGSDEKGCPNLDTIQRGRFQINSQQTELVLPQVTLDDAMCFQCVVENEHGYLFGDGCLTVIDKIDLFLPPNDTYHVKPDMVINIGVDAVTDKDWMNQMDFTWYWFEPVKDKETGNTIYVKKTLPPTGPFRSYFSLSLSNKNLTIVIPKIDTKNEKQDARMYEIYDMMTDYRLFQLEVSHKYDSDVRNFTIIGEKVEKPIIKPVVTTASFNLWFIALILAILILFIVIALIVCYMHRNRGGTYLLDKKEKQAGNDPEEELKHDGFHDVGRIDDDDYNDNPDEKVSLSESVKPYESDEDITEEYGGDFDVSKFNEDGSFIGLYGDKKSKYATESKEATV